MSSRWMELAVRLMGTPSVIRIVRIIQGRAAAVMDFVVTLPRKQPLHTPLSAANDGSIATAELAANTDHAL